MLADDGITLTTAQVISLIVFLAVVGIGGLFGLLMKLHAERLAESKDREETSKRIAAESIKALTAYANAQRAKEGLPPIPLVAPVVAESRSPPNEQQKFTAEAATMRATLTAVKLAIGQPTRMEGETGTEDDKPPDVCAAAAFHLDIAKEQIEVAKAVIEGEEKPKE